MASINSAAFSSADAALLSSVLDPQYSGSRTPSDNRVISREVSKGATLAYDETAGITTISGGAGPIKKESDQRDINDENQNFKRGWMAIDLVNLDGNQ